MICALAIAFKFIMAPTEAGFIERIEGLRDAMLMNQILDIHQVVESDLERLKNVINTIPGVAATIQDGKIRMVRFK